jgi:hypothetical protein
MIISCLIGYGFVSKLPWEGYLFPIFKLNFLIGSDIGLFLSMGIALFGTLFFAKNRVKNQELKQSIKKF